MSDIVERLRATPVRTSTEARMAIREMMKEAADEIERLLADQDMLSRKLGFVMVERDRYKAALERLIEAWESLPGPHHYTPRQVGHWLTLTMTPTVDKGRAALRGEEK